MAAAQARASSVALPTPLPSSGTSSPILHRASASQQARSTTTASPEFLVRKSSSRKVGRATDTIDENDDDDDDMKKPRIPKKSKSRTVIGHPGSSRKVDVPTSASESEGD